jgi:hypothetical protein
MAKHVFSALPIYPIGIFRIPKTILDKIDAITARFIWKGELQGKGLLICLCYTPYLAYILTTL